MKHAHNTSISSERLKDYLALSRRNLGNRANRVARLSGAPLMAAPLDATLRDGFLTWTCYSDELDGPRRSPASQAAPPQLCFAFARLAQASDEGVRRFAKK